MKVNFEVTPDTFDPTTIYGDEAVVYRQQFPQHATITWNDIVPMWQEERNNDFLRMLHIAPVPVPDEKVHMNEVVYDGESDMPDLSNEHDRSIYMPTLITHTQDNLNDRVREIVQEEAKEQYKLNNLHIYSTLLAESFVFKSHKDPHSIMLVQCIGNTQYGFEDGRNIMLEPGDGLYIPRGIYHAPRVFGPRVTFSYNWHYRR